MATAAGRRPAPQRSRTAGAARATAPAPARAPERVRPKPVTRQPRGRVVRRPDRRRARGFTLAAIGTVCALVFAVVFHVILAQSQLELDQLTDKIATAQRSYETRRLEVAKMSAPERIIAAAQRLGLQLPPDPPVYLSVVGAPAPAAESSPSTTLQEWKAVKPHLGDPQP